jgi:hypothetical protein
MGEHEAGAFRRPDARAAHEDRATRADPGGHAHPFAQVRQQQRRGACRSRRPSADRSGRRGGCRHGLRRLRRRHDRVPGRMGNRRAPIYLQAQAPRPCLRAGRDDRDRRVDGKANERRPSCPRPAPSSNASTASRRSARCAPLRPCSVTSRCASPGTYRRRFEPQGRDSPTCVRDAHALSRRWDYAWRARVMGRTFAAGGAAGLQRSLIRRRGRAREFLEHLGFQPISRGSLRMAGIAQMPSPDGCPRRHDGRMGRSLTGASQIAGGIARAARPTIRRSRPTCCGGPDAGRVPAHGGR